MKHLTFKSIVSKKKQKRVGVNNFFNSFELTHHIHKFILLPVLFF